uniref:Uncharacterized protein n=1 Tax=Populus trichocarpa TaxID=3694 RepID=A0A2K2BZT2_POPTR
MRKAGDEVKGASLASDAFFLIAWNDTVEKHRLILGGLCRMGPRRSLMAMDLMQLELRVTTLLQSTLMVNKSDAIDIDKDLVGDEKDIEIAAVMVWFPIKKIP